MSRPFAHTSAAAAALVLVAPTAAAPTPGAGAAGTASLEELLPRASVALALPGTDQVAIHPDGRCIDVQVRTPGTGRLAALILRGVDVPWEVVSIRVVEETPAGGA